MMKHKFFRFFVGISFLPILFSSTVSAEVDLRPCKPAGYDGEARCGTYEVYENRAAAAGRKIALRVIVLPASAAVRQPDPIVYFAGGPGNSSVDMAGLLPYVDAALSSRRDVVLIDFRGTGGSNPLFCPHQTEDSELLVREVLEGFLPAERIADCRRALEARNDLRQYDSPQMIDDVREALDALGYKQVNIMGGSYGSQAALIYLRRHPETVRTATINGIAPTGTKNPLAFARNAQDAFDALVAECAADVECSDAFPDPAGDLRDVLERLRREPVRETVSDPEGSGDVEVELSVNVLTQSLRYMLYSPLGALEIPAYLRAAAEGNFELFARFALHNVAGTLNDSPTGFYLSITCGESVAQIESEEVAAAVAGTFMGDFRVRRQRAACAHWTRSELPENFHEHVRSDKPVLLISGARDPVTPPSWGEEAAAHLSQSRHLVIPHGAHSLRGLIGVECVDEQVRLFVESASFDDLDLAGCAASVSRPDFLLHVEAEPTLAMSRETLGRFVGRYESDRGMNMELVLEDEGLRVLFLEVDWVLRPIGPLRFHIRDNPPGSGVIFQEEGDSLVGATLLRGGNPWLVFRRVE